MTDRRDELSDIASTLVVWMVLLGTLAGSVALLTSPILATRPLPAITPRTDVTPVPWSTPTPSIELGFASVATPLPAFSVGITDYALLAPCGLYTVEIPDLSTATQPVPDCRLAVGHYGGA